MIRKPNPQAQAKLLVDALKARNIELKLGTALDIVARQHGHKSWNVMAAAQKKTPAKNSTVLRAPSRTHVADKSIQGWAIGDVIEVRPDLYPGEALTLLQEVVHRMDASVGINWDVISNHADWTFPEHRSAIVHTVALGVSRMVEVDLATGDVYDVPDAQEAGSRLVLRSAEDRQRLVEAGLDGNVELLFGDRSFTVDDVQEETGCRREIFEALADPRLMQLAPEREDLPYGMHVTVDAQGATLDAGGLFTQLEAPKFSELGDNVDVSTAAASGAAEALSALMLALAARGIDVWGTEFNAALEQAVESISNELA